jgi:peptide/nickel transport system permease protein
MERDLPTTQTPALESGRRWGILPRVVLPDTLRGFLRNRKALLGSGIMLFFIFVALFANDIAPISGRAGANRMVGRPHEAPSSEHWFGTTRQGQDVFTQVVHGARLSLTVGFGAGSAIIALCILVGISSGYLGGLLDEILSLIMNVFLVLPGLPLVIVVSGWVDQPGPLTIGLVLAFTSWAYGARVLRSQTLVLRNSEFVAAARVVGEPSWRIILFEILPNMISLVVASWIGAVIYVIITEATLDFIGLGNPNSVSWGTSLYWAQNNQALLTRAWWTFVPPGLCIALVGLSLTLINYGLDEITNPRLKVGEGA